MNKQTFEELLAASLKAAGMLAEHYALDCHESTNHLYDGQPYSVHLEAVVAVAEKFKHLVPKDQYISIIAACWCHDVIEDTRQTYNDVKNATNEEVAEIVYALTNEKGKNRKQRANDKYYTGIWNTPGATFVKLCDRIANVKYSANTQSRMLDLYRKEHKSFCENMNRATDDRYDEMWEHLDSLLENVGATRNEEIKQKKENP